ncbi:posterior protein-like [Xenopus laevis]|uniref:Posterior protein-like n=1 Tax=Xenopus laevis TaxID=8355 RepID=A0A8J1MQJ3_XENLA|nr:posterior protein-like [Xenopus laevis]
MFKAGRVTLRGGVDGVTDGNFEVEESSRDWNRRCSWREAQVSSLDNYVNERSSLSLTEQLSSGAHTQRGHFLSSQLERTKWSSKNVPILEHDSDNHDQSQGGSVTNVSPFSLSNKVEGVIVPQNHKREGGPGFGTMKLPQCKPPSGDKGEPAGDYAGWVYLVTPNAGSQGIMDKGVTRALKTLENAYLMRGDDPVLFCYNYLALYRAAYNNPDMSPNNSHFLYSMANKCPFLDQATRMALIHANSFQRFLHILLDRTGEDYSKSNSGKTHKKVNQMMISGDFGLLIRRDCRGQNITCKCSPEVKHMRPWKDNLNPRESSPLCYGLLHHALGREHLKEHPTNCHYEEMGSQDPTLCIVSQIHKDLDGRPIIQGTVGGYCARMLLDTGADVSITHLNLIEDPLGGMHILEGLGGHEMIFKRSLPVKVTLGDLCVLHSFFISSTHKETIIGCDVMKKHNLIIDLCDWILWKGSKRH